MFQVKVFEDESLWGLEEQVNSFLEEVTYKEMCMFQDAGTGKYCANVVYKYNDYDVNNI